MICVVIFCIKVLNGDKLKALTCIYKRLAKKLKENSDKQFDYN